MVNYQDDARVNLKNTQLKKLKYTAKNKAQTTLILSKKNLEDEFIHMNYFYQQDRRLT